MVTTEAVPDTRLAQRGILIVLCVGSLLACNGEAAGGAAATGDDPSDRAAAAVDKAVDEAAKSAGAKHLFDPADKALRKRACEFLTAELVSSLFEVPADDLKQLKIMGCVYTWKKDGQILDAKLMMIRVHKTLEGATTWFGNATATKTKQQLDAEMDVVKAKVRERKELDTKLKKNTAASIADIAKMGSPDEGVSYDDVPGVADAARVSNTDGVMWVRMGNMTFQVSAFKGPQQPKLKIDPKNLKGIVKASMAAQNAWVKDTLDGRKQGAMKLAPRIVEAISAGAAGQP